jgi:hypothetical protein
MCKKKQIANAFKETVVHKCNDSNTSILHQWILRRAN